MRVLIAGIGGASLGTEILKCLCLSGDYTVYGCDISNLAYGHYEEGFAKTFVVDHEHYVESVLDICLKEHVQCIIPGGEEPMLLLSKTIEAFQNEGIRLACNSLDVVDICSNKDNTFEFLAQHGFNIPLTISAADPDDLENMVFPCVIKPATGSGGSNFVFVAEDRDEAQTYIQYLSRNGLQAIVQEYIGLDEGEFTVGVLCLPGCQIAGSIALRRCFHNKLSVLVKTKTALLSTGYTQGYIADFPKVRATAERIASCIQSEGPINIQGRVRNEELIPFEINPRFSASTYLRAMAGMNEVDIYLKYLVTGELQKLEKIRPGYYLRSFSEVYVCPDKVLKS
ncbi:MAG: ATP-grasp domain-containing protein [Desulfobacterales bacterium]|nr:ATP-grasp domain-containing protein [Desulfobacterales bacterium]